MITTFQGESLHEFDITQKVIEMSESDIAKLSDSDKSTAHEALYVSGTMRNTEPVLQSYDPRQRGSAMSALSQRQEKYLAVMRLLSK